MRGQYNSVADQEKGSVDMGGQIWSALYSLWSVSVETRWFNLET